MWQVRLRRPRRYITHNSCNNVVRGPSIVMSSCHGRWTRAACTRLFFRAGLACSRQRRRGLRVSEVHTVEFAGRSALLHKSGPPPNVAFDPLRVATLRTTSFKSVSFAPENKRMSRCRVKKKVVHTDTKCQNVQYY